ncbi:FkbM family methyltransferase [Fodinibius halophilus]|uniref:FkbM family methyltransferase n=1 Tax=Fodinibius halophilus TaxID=1736908 RepID=A0A6M1T0A7_9BACT|nr:FkbM family methyltransferase [Fodinibius halophilus]NGP87359.1 FkbM family methyltransferase [Fodinibius halophilus]
MSNSAIPERNMYQIETKDGIIVCTPDDIQTMTSVVLLEQEDWFEQELDFLREYLQPGMNVVDGGASFGTFSLPMAREVGEHGMVYAFEPSATTRKYLESSKQKNNFDQLEIVEKALGDKVGKGRLRIADTPERNTVDKKGKEAIAMTTLDAWWNYVGNCSVDVIKLDVNGMEDKALKGAQQLLTQEQPVVLVSLDAKEDLQAAIEEQLQKAGYRLFDYIPGPELLVDHEAKADEDPYLMNIVGIHQDRVEEFKKKGWIFDEEVSFDIPRKDKWKEVLGDLRWSKNKIEDWEDKVAGEQHREYLEALNILCAANQISPETSADASARSRKGAMMLDAAQRLIEIFNKGNGTISAAMSYARSMYELGKRTQAIDMVKGLMETVGAEEAAANSLPFLPPLPEQDETKVQTDFSKWLFVRTVEAWINMKDASVYMSGEQEKELIKVLKDNPEAVALMAKKNYLLSDGQEEGVAVGQISRNRWFWNEKESNLSVNRNGRLVNDRQNSVLSHIYLTVPGVKGGAHGIHEARTHKLAAEIERQGVGVSVISGESPDFVQKVVEASHNEGHVFYTGIMGFDLSVSSQLNVTGNLFELLDVPVFGLLGDHPYTEFMWHRMEQLGNTTLVSPLPSVKEEYDEIFSGDNDVVLSEHPPPPSPKDGGAQDIVPLAKRPIDMLIPWGIHKFYRDQRTLDEKLKVIGKPALKIGMELFKSALRNYEESIYQIFQRTYKQAYGSRYAFDNPKTNEDKCWLKVLSLVDWTIRKKRRLQMLKMLPALPDDLNITITAHSKVGKVLPFLDDMKNINWVNEMEISELDRLYARSKVVLNCNPTYPDTIHGRVRSGMANGCYVVSDYNPALEETFGSEAIGLINQQKDSLIQYFTDDWEKVQAKAERGRQIVLDSFTVEKQAQRLIEIITNHIE